MNANRGPRELTDHPLYEMRAAALFLVFVLLGSSGLGCGDGAAPPFDPPPTMDNPTSRSTTTTVDPPAPPPGVDSQLRELATADGSARHLALLRDVDPSALDQSCLEADFPSFAARMDAFDEPSVTRTAACIESRCFVQLVSVGERTAVALLVWYTHAQGGSVHSVRCETMRGG